MEGVVNGKEVPTSLVQVADTNRNIFLFRQARLFKEERVRKSPPFPFLEKSIERKSLQK